MPVREVEDSVPWAQYRNLIGLTTLALSFHTRTSPSVHLLGSILRYLFKPWIIDPAYTWIDFIIIFFCVCVGWGGGGQFNFVEDIVPAKQQIIENSVSVVILFQCVHSSSVF